MKPQLLKVFNGPGHSFSIRKDSMPLNNNRWHYHPEVELIYFKKGGGLQFIGDSIKRFKDGNMVLIGAQLSHFWRFDDAYLTTGEKVNSDIRAVHFRENFWGNDFLNLPENKPIKMVLEKAKRGLEITGKTKKMVEGLLERAEEAEGTVRIILLMEILLLISQSENLNVLSSLGFNLQKERQKEDKRLNAIVEFSFANFRRKIELEEVAEVACLCPNYFCRFFKSRTGKTYKQFLNEIKIGHACKLLVESKKNIQQIAYESGFNNFASFYKLFKQQTGKSPLAYQKEYLHQSLLISA